MLVALFLPRLLDLLPDRPVMLSGSVFMAAGVAWVATGPTFMTLLAAWFCVGFGWSLVQTPAGRVVNRSAAPGDRPAYFSAQFALSHLCWLIFYPLAGQLSTRIGIETTALIMAGGILIFTLAAAILWPSRDRERISHVHDEIEHEHEHEHGEHHSHEHSGLVEDEPHIHVHRHDSIKHEHSFVIDDHHMAWPQSSRP